MAAWVYAFHVIGKIFVLKNYVFENIYQMVFFCNCLPTNKVFSVFQVLIKL